MFVAFADFSSNVLDAQGVDGLVNGAGAVTKRLAGALRMTQTGYARTYALAVFLGAVGLLVYFWSSPPGIWNWSWRGTAAGRQRQGCSQTPPAWLDPITNT